MLGRQNIVRPKRPVRPDLSIPSLTKTCARERAHPLRSFHLILGLLNCFTSSTHGGEILFIPACYQFLEYLKSVKNASEHTIRNYAIDLNALKDFVQIDLLPDGKPEDRPAKIRYDQEYSARFQGKDNAIQISEIDKKLIRRFLADLHTKGHNKSTIVRRLSSLRTFFKFALSHNLLAANPTEDLDSPKIDKRIPVSLSYEHVQRLLEQPETSDYLGFRDRAIMELFYSSGLRVSELVGLDRADIDHPQLMIRVRGKGKKERVVPITKNASEWILAYINHPERHQDIDGHQAQVDREAIFLNRLGTRLTARSVDRSFEKYLKASGLADKITPHTIRHTIATHWLENGMDLKTIQEMLGHRTLAATTIYTRVSPKLKKEVYDEAHPRAK